MLQIYEYVSGSWSIIFYKLFFILHIIHMFQIVGWNCDIKIFWIILHQIIVSWSSDITARYFTSIKFYFRIFWSLEIFLSKYTFSRWATVRAFRICLSQETLFAIIKLLYVCLVRTRCSYTVFVHEYFTQYVQQTGRKEESDGKKHIKQLDENISLVIPIDLYSMLSHLLGCTTSWISERKLHALGRDAIPPSDLVPFSKEWDFHLVETSDLARQDLILILSLSKQRPHKLHSSNSIHSVIGLLIINHMHRVIYLFNILISDVDISRENEFAIFNLLSCKENIYI